VHISRHVAVSFLPIVQHVRQDANSRQARVDDVKLQLLAKKHLKVKRHMQKIFFRKSAKLSLFYVFYMMWGFYSYNGHSDCLFIKSVAICYEEKNSKVGKILPLLRLL
jgi:hypothetical protein